MVIENKLIFRLTWSAELGDYSIRVNFGRSPYDLTDEEYRRLGEDVEEIITTVALEFVDEVIDAHTIHAVRIAIGEALSERYGDYYPRVAIG